MKTFLTISILLFFDTFCLGITKHLTSLKPVLVFSLMLQSHIETNDLFQMAGRIRGATESRVWSPSSWNSFFLHPLLYLLLENMPAPSFCPNPFFIPSTCRAFRPAIQLTIQRVFGDHGPLCDSPQLGHQIESLLITVLGLWHVALQKCDCSFIRPNIEMCCLY